MRATRFASGWTNTVCVRSGTTVFSDQYYFQEAVARHGWRYEYLAFNLFAKQAAVVLR